MEKKQLKTLQLLEAIEQKKKQSQRELSKKLNISLGLVNRFIKDLKDQGIIEAIKPLNYTTEYFLTAKGIEKKNQLRMQHVSYALQFYNRIKHMIEKRLSEVKTVNENNLILYGAGELCEIACIYLRNDKRTKIKIIDDEEAGNYTCGIKIRNEKDLDRMDYDDLIIMKLDEDDLIQKRLVAKGIPPEKISTIV